jgi:putative ABC transport system permease protein
MSKPPDLVQGTLDLLLLKIVALEPLHEWAISQRLRQVSSEELQVSEGSLYPSDLFPPGLTRLPRRTVVGVIRDFRQNGLDREVNPEVFVPVAQLPLDGWKEQFAQEFMSPHFLVARTVGDPLAATPAIQAVVSRLDRNIAVATVRTMESRLADSMAQRRFAMLLLTGFAGLALVLALVGLYGVMAYTVNQRQKEFGVRAALGASAAGLLRLVLAEGLWMTAIGAAIGVLLASVLSRLMTAHLFGVEPVDPVLYAGVTLLLAAVASLACGVPALRAARVDPAAALRGE